MLDRAEGATIDEIVAATGWQPHRVRGAFAGALKMNHRRLKSTDVIDVLSDLFILRGVPGHVRSDNGPEFIAKAVREWIAAVEPGPRSSSPEAPGRTATARASTPSSATSC